MMKPGFAAPSAAGASHSDEWRSAEKFGFVFPSPFLDILQVPSARNIVPSAMRLRLNNLVRNLCKTFLSSHESLCRINCDDAAN
jgi:hypothetical protein